MTTVEKLLELLGQANETDLTALDERIKALESEVAALGRVRTVIKKRIYGRTVKVGCASRSNGAAASSLAGSSTHDRRVRVAKILVTEGPQLSNVIADKIGAAPQGIVATLNCDWFQQTKEGWRLTEVGRREALGQK